MKNIISTGKKLNIELDQDFPFSINDTYGIDKGSTMLHWHDCIEICYLKQGRGMYLIGGRNYSFNKGDIFIINSKEIHLAYNDREVIMQVLMFESRFLWNGAGYPFEAEYLKPFWESGINFGNKLDKSNKYYESIVEVLLEIEHENKAEGIGYKLMMKSFLLKLAAILTRYLDVKDDGWLRERMRNHNRLEPVFDYMDCNYYIRVKLKELATLVNMSVPNFSLVFKKTIGISPMEYLNRVRIVKASQALLETDLKIIDIAADCGFCSMSNFIENFKIYTGKVPKEFRKIRK